MKLNKVLRKGTAILLIFAVWQFACFKTGNEILLPSPERVFAVLLKEVQKERFRFIILSSVIRICKGFLAAFLAGFVLASLAFFIRPLKRSGKTISGSIKGYPCSIFCCDVVNLDRFRESGRVDLLSGGISGYLRKYPCQDMKMRILCWRKKQGYTR